MALDLNEYIKMSYERPNRKVLEGLGASEGLIEYLMETPGNTNWNVVETIENADGGDDDWTVIRLDYDAITELNPTLITTKTEDISNFLELYDMYVNDQHPIIVLNGVTFGKEKKNVPINYMTDGYMGDDCKFFIGEIMRVPVQYLQGNQEYPSKLKFYANNSQDALENDYIEIKYKTGNYYTVTTPDISSNIFTVEQNSSWNLGTFFADMGAPGYGFTDGTNSYFDGDTIVFNKNTTLNLVAPN